MERQDKGNNIGLKTIGELFGTRFFVPNYQRGYRWTQQQVIDLLNDIKEFNEERDGFYCLQPLVVKQREEDTLNKIREANNLEEVKNLLKGDWEVIDGQQRLTTIYILLTCLGVSCPYSLEYETRKSSAEFLKNMDSYDRNVNIDYFFMAKAKESVTMWMQEQFGTDENNKKSYMKKLKGKVKFIWYETTEEDPIKVFTRLNIGKIALTNSELVKALFLNSSNFSNSIQLRQQEIAGEWDKIEYALQNDEFWMFLHNKGYDRPIRIDFILDLICKQNALNINEFTNEEEKDKIIGTDRYRTFRYFYEYFKSMRLDAVNQIKAETAWQEIKSVYQIFNEWFNDLETYHYVGFLVACGIYVENLVKLWKENGNKKVFINLLKEEIKKKTDKTDIEFQYKEDGSDKTRCRPLLLFHNIQTVINQNKAQLNNAKYKTGVFYKFPFHLYKLEGWDVEHVNSNTNNPEEDDNTRKEWLINVYIGADASIQETIVSYFAIKDDETKKNELFNKVKKAFPEPEKWSIEEKNRIGNYTLLDSSTNRSYGNAIFSAKRRIIIGKDKGYTIQVPKLNKDGEFEVNDENMPANSSFVPPCTKQVFLKYFSATAGDNNYWTKEDAEAYKNDIKSCLEKLNEK